MSKHREELFTLGRTDLVNRIEALEAQADIDKDFIRQYQRQVAELQAKLDIAHNWVLDNQVHSESYNQFNRLMQQQEGK